MGEPVAVQVESLLTGDEAEEDNSMYVYDVTHIVQLMMGQDGWRVGRIV